MVSHCTEGLLVLGSQRDEERGGENEQIWTGKAASNLAQLQAVNFLKVMGCVSECVCACACVCPCALTGFCVFAVCVASCLRLNMSKHF